LERWKERTREVTGLRDTNQKDRDLVLWDDRRKERVMGQGHTPKWDAGEELGSRSSKWGGRGRIARNNRIKDSRVSAGRRDLHEAKEEHLR